MQVATEEQAGGDSVSLQDGELQPRDMLDQVEVKTVDGDSNSLKPMNM